MKWQFLGGLSLGDWELSNSTLNVIMRRFGSVHRFLPLFQQVISNYVTLTQARTHTCKGKKGHRDNWKERFGSAADKNAFISATYPTNSFRSSRYFFSPPWLVLPISHCHTRNMEIFSPSLLIILIESPFSGISQRLIRRQAGWESVLLGKVSSPGDTTPFWSATQKPPSAAESGRYHRTPQRHNHKYIRLVKNTRGLCCRADNDTANPVETHDWRGREVTKVREMGHFLPGTPMIFKHSTSFVM